MRLDELVRTAGLTAVTDAAARSSSVSGLAYSSDSVHGGDLFFALPGHHRHGGRYIEAAIRAGAIAVITDSTGAELAGSIPVDAAVPVIVVEDPRKAMAQVAVAFYGDPASQLAMLGVTGTNGKTTTTFLLQAALDAAKMPCGVIGTLGARLPGWNPRAHARTTPEAPDLNEMLSSMQEIGARAVAMEVSSIAVREHRVDGIKFDVMGFTGLTQDHLDYHETMEDYFAAKAELFTTQRTELGVVLVDSEWGVRLASDATVPILRIGYEASRSSLADGADWWVMPTRDGFELVGSEQVAVSLPLATDFALANAAVAIVMAHTQGVALPIAAQAVASAHVPGRMELVASIAGIDFFVDYAHSPDAVERVVGAAVAACDTRGGRVIVVLGAGGDRDEGKRQAMGSAAERADVVVVTDDNPRNEDPRRIRRMVLSGMSRDDSGVHEIAPREYAIAWAVAEARPNDLVLILGKGHETTQEWGDRVVPFDDREVLASFVQRRFEEDGSDVRGEAGQGEST